MYFDKITYKGSVSGINNISSNDFSSGDLIYDTLTSTTYLCNNSGVWNTISSYNYEEKITNYEEKITEIKSYNCPNCGAPLKIKYKGIDNCPYCDSLLYAN